ncbi:MAG: glycosyltransferase family 2 protein [Muribaculaceae bacterium]|nr:glycosyltransferase family 2 protein [Muribaculaceae bacterium]
MSTASTNPIITIVVPVYNAQAYLRECLQSIAAQTFGNFRVLIIDDASTDSSCKIAEEFCFCDARFELLTIEHGGVSKARNTGIAHTATKYISFVDADDMLHPQMLEMLLKTATDLDAQAVICGMVRGERCPFKSLPDKQEEYAVKDIAGKATIYTYQEAMRAALYQSVILNSPCGLLLDTSLLTPEALFREGTRFEDLDAFYRYLEGAWRIAVIPQKLYFYRTNPQSFMNRWSTERLDVLDVVDRMTNWMHQRYPELDAAVADRSFSAHFNTLLLLYRHRIDNSNAEKRCIGVIQNLRRAELTNPDVRLKNKAGALLSYPGSPVLRIASRFYFL